MKPQTDAAEITRLREIEKLARLLMDYATPWIEDYGEEEAPRKVWDRLEVLLAKPRQTP